MSFTIARRYAHALADVLRPTGDYAAALAQLENYGAIWLECDDLREAFESPVVSPASKQKVLDAILARLGTSHTVSNFLRVLLAHFRMGMLEEVVQAYRKVVNQRLGIVEIRIAYPRDFLEQEQNTLKERFSRLTGQRAEIDFQRDEELIGGVLAQVGSVVYDGSVKGFLERLRQSLSAA
jgi:F-type H+-transporting ATPase subunit delta